MGSSSQPPITTVDGPQLPGWVQQWVPHPVGPIAGGAMQLWRHGRAAMACTAVAAAVHMQADAFRLATAAAYDQLLKTLNATPPLRPVRFWNFIPGITHDMGGGQDRYMVFNAGRYDALIGRYGSREALEQQVATASAVGYGGTDLVVYALAEESAARAVRNPRQVQPHRYSTRFGPLPPCFARATLLEQSAEQGRVLLVGGTASIRGEESMHRDDLAGQFGETLANLAALVGMIPGLQGQPSAEAFGAVRIYHRRSTDAPWLAEAAKAAFPRANSLELMHAELCRGELLLEIEGLAELAVPA